METGGDGMDDSLRMPSLCSLLAGKSRSRGVVSLSEYKERLLAGRGIVDLCPSLLKVVPVTAWGCPCCLILGP